MSNIFIHNENAKYLYHGSPIKINDRDIATGTYFTEDVEIAREYGNFIYSIELDEKIKTVMQLDSLGEHFTNIRLIPIYLFNIEEL